MKIVETCLGASESIVFPCVSKENREYNEKMEEISSLRNVIEDALLKQTSNATT